MTSPREGEALGNYDAGISSALAPSLDVNLSRITRGVYVGVSGNLEVIFAGDTVGVTLVGLAAGVWHPMQIQQIVSAGTTATSIVVGF